MKRAIHICSFESTDHLRGKARTYDAVKQSVLAAGRFSIFEATKNSATAAMFDRLERDPGVETFRDPPGYPWIGIRRRQS